VPIELRLETIHSRAYGDREDVELCSLLYYSACTVLPVQPTNQPPAQGVAVGVL
jgi:hypothetical protein